MMLIKRKQDLFLIAYLKTFKRVKNFYLAKAVIPSSETNLHPLKLTFVKCLQLSANKARKRSSTDAICEVSKS